jgi:F-type H+-transporting ATPase subunit epsilon
MSKFVLEIHTIEKTIVSEEIDKVTVPTKNEELTILPGHAPIITNLGYGTLTYNSQKGEQFLFISGGFMEVQNERVIVLADLIERPEEIDEKEIEKAKKEAEDILQSKPVGGRSMASAQADLNVALRKSKVIEKHRRRG